MKNRKTIFLSLTALLAVVVALIGVLTQNVGAFYKGSATPTPGSNYVSIGFEAYSLDDYEIKTGFNTKYGMSVDDAQGVVDQYDAYAISDPSDPDYTDPSLVGSGYATNAALANAYWDGTLLADVNSIEFPTITSTTKYSTVQAYADGWQIDNGYVSSLGTASGVAYNYVTKSGSGATAKAIKNNGSYTGAGFTVSQVKTDIAAYNAVSPTTEFEPGQKIVIIAKVTPESVYNNMAVTFDMSFLGGKTANAANYTAASGLTQPTTALYKGSNSSFLKEKSGDSTSSLTANNIYIYEGSAGYPNAYSLPITGSTKSAKFGGYTASSGQDFDGTTGPDGTYDILFAIAFQVDANADGDYFIEPEVSDNTTYSVSTTSGTKKYQTNNNLFEVEPLKINVSAAISNDTTFKNMAIGGVSKNPDPTSATTDVTTFNVGGTNYKGFKATATNGTTNTSILAEVNKKGTIQSVVYAGSAATALAGAKDLAPTAAGGNALTTTTNGTKATYNSTTKDYDVVLGAPGSKTYAAMCVLASDGTTYEYYVIEIEKDKNTIASLTGLTITSDQTVASLVSTDIGAGTAVALQTSFNGSTSGNYLLNIPDSAGNVKITPTWNLADLSTVTITSGSYNVTYYPYTATSDSSKQAGKTYYTCSGTTYTPFTGASFVAGTTYYEATPIPEITLSTGATALAAITVKVTPQDGNAANTKTFTITRAKTVYDITNLTATESDVAGTSTALAFDQGAFVTTTDTYTATALYTSNKYKVVPTKGDADQNIAYTVASTSDTVTLVSGSNQTVINATAVTGTAIKTLTITVSAQNSNYSKVYKVQVGKPKANDDYGFDLSWTAKDASGATVATGTDTITNAMITGGATSWTLPAASTFPKNASKVDFTVTPLANPDITTSTTVTTKVTYGSQTSKTTAEIAASGGNGYITVTNQTLSIGASPTGTGSKQTQFILNLKTQANASGHSFTLNFETKNRISDSSNSFSVFGFNDAATHGAYAQTATSTAANPAYELKVADTGPNAFFKISGVDVNGAVYYRVGSAFPSTENTAAKSALSSLSNNVALDATGAGQSGNFTIGTTTVATKVYLRVYSEFAMTEVATTAIVVYSDYTLEIFAAKDTDNEVTSLYVDGDTTILSNTSSSPYTYNVAFSTTSVDFKFTTKTAFSTVHMSKNLTDLGTTAAQRQTGGSGTFTVSLTRGTTAKTNTYYFRCYSQSNAASTITFQIDVVVAAAEIDQDLASLTVGGTPVTLSTSGNDVYFIPYTGASATVSYTLTTGSSKAQESIAYTTSDSSASGSGNLTLPVNVPNNGYSEVIIKVLSEYNQSPLGSATATHDYIIYIIRADQDASVSSIKINEANSSSGDSGTQLADENGNTFAFNNTMFGTTQNFDMIFSSKAPYIAVTATSADAVVTGAGYYAISNNTTSDASETKTVTIKSKFYSILEGIVTSHSAYSNSILTPYKSGTNKQVFDLDINFTRRGASTNNTFTSATITMNGGNLNAVANNIVDNLLLENLGSVSTATIVMSLPTGAKFEVSLSTAGKVSATDTFNTPLPSAAGSSLPFTVKVYSEANIASIAGVPAPQVYNITLAQGLATLDTDSSLSSLSVVGDNGVSYISGQKTFASGTVYYPLVIPGNVSAIDIFLTPAKSTSSVKLDGASCDTTGAANNYSLAGKTSPVRIEIDVYAQSHTTAAPATTQYVIEITITALDNTDTLDSLSYNGIPVPGFTSGGNTYTINLPHSALTTPGSIGLSYTQTKASDGTVKSTATTNADPLSPLTLVVGTTGTVATVSVQAENTSKAPNVYTITFIVDDDTSLSMLEVVDSDGTDLITKSTQGTFAPSVRGYSGIVVGYNYSSVTVNYAQVGTYVTVAITEVGGTQTCLNGGTINLNANAITTIEITITPSDPANAISYTVAIKREKGNDEALITSYITEDGTSLSMVTSRFAYTYIIDRTTYATSATNFAPTITQSTNASVAMPTVTTLNLGMNTMIVTITSEDGTVINPYTFTIYVADIDYRISDIKLTDTAGNEAIFEDSTSTAAARSFTDKYIYSDSVLTNPLTVASSTTDVKLNLTTENTNAVVLVDGVQYVNGTNISLGVPGASKTFTVVVKSDYANVNPSAAALPYTMYIDGNATTALESDTFTFTITRLAPSTDATLKDLKVIVGGVDLLADLAHSKTPFASGTLEYEVEEIGNGTQLTITADPTDPNATVSGVGSKTLQAYSSATSGYVFTYEIEVTPEDTTAAHKTYKVTVSRGPIKVDANADINYISVLDSDGVEYIGSAKFSTSSLTYEFDMPYGPKSFTISVNKEQYVTSKVSIDGSTYTSGYSKQIQITKDLYNKTKTYKVYSLSKDNTVSNPTSFLTDGTTYEIKIKFLAASADTSLSLFTAGGTNVTLQDTTRTGASKLDITAYTDHDTFRFALPNVANNKSTLQFKILANDSNSIVTLNNSVIKVSNPIKTVLLADGQNSFIFIVTAESGDTATYIVDVYKSYPDPTVTNIVIDGQDLLDVNDQATKFNKEVDEYHAIVSYYTFYVTIKVTVDNPSYTVTVTNCSGNESDKNSITKSFQNKSSLEPVSMAVYKVTVSSTEGTSISYTLVIKHNTQDSLNTNLKSIELTNVPDLTTDYKNDKSVYGTYSVPNSVTKVDIKNYIPEIKGCTAEIYNADDLKVGVNQLVIKVTAEDGTTTRAIMVTVERAQMEFTVNTGEKAIVTEDKKTFAVDENKDGTYTLSLGTTKLSELCPKDAKGNIDTSNLVDLIVPGSESNVTVDVVSDVSNDNLNQVILQVSDGTTTELIYVKLDKTKLSFTVNPEKGGYETKFTDQATNTLSIDLKNASPTSMTESDFINYIESDNLDKYTMKVVNSITDDTRQVVVAVEDDNGTINYVTFNLNVDSSIWGGAFNIVVWALLGVALALLLTILICVNKDKYGNVSKKRRKEN